MKGRGIPVTGMIPSVIPTLINTWNNHIEKMPQAKRLPKISSEDFAITNVLYSNKKYRNITKIEPTKPNSSPITEKIKSV